MYRMLALDLPGHGESGKSENPEDDYSINSYLGILEEFVQQRALKKVLLVGHSLGGHLAIHLMHQLKRQNCKVMGMLLMGTPPLTLPPKMEQAFLSNPAMAFAFKPDLAVEELETLAGAYINPEDKNFSSVLSCIEDTDPWVRPMVGQSIATQLIDDETELLKAAGLKICLVHGQEDMLINDTYIKNLNLPLWNGQIQYIENASHSPFLENEGQFNRLLESYLSDLSK